MSLMCVRVPTHKPDTVLMQVTTPVGTMILVLNFGLIHQLKTMILPKQAALEESDFQVTTVLSMKLHVAIGHNSGIYPQDCITGFKFKYYAMSGSRKIYPRKWGFGLRKMTNNDQWLYSIGSLSQPGSSGDVTKSHTFNSTALSYLSSGYCFEELHLELSTDNCCSNNDSECYIFGFEFQYKAPSGAKLIIPYPRPFSDRNNYRIA